MAEMPCLTGRQVEVLRQVASGHSYGQVAKDLDISLHTVKTHAREMISRLGAQDRCHAVAIGFALGILKPADVLEASP